MPDLTGQKTVVEVISLDKFFLERGWPPIDLIKIDVEGAEKMVLEGMRGLIERNRDLKLIIELNPSFLSIADTSAEELLGLLSGLGFDRVRVLSGEMKVYIIPQDIPYLANLGRKSGYVNLFCEGHHVR